jgi:hypothetical protein
MDADRFDAISRSLSVRQTRRRLTRLLLGIGSGGVLSALEPMETRAAKRIGGAPCRKGSQCKTGRCVRQSGQKVCSCSKKHAACKPPADPCQTAVCNTDAGRCGNQEACPMEEPQTCGRTGACSGGTCEVYAVGTICGSLSCSGSIFTAERCDETGACVAQQQECAPGTCGFGGCH